MNFNFTDFRRQWNPWNKTRNKICFLKG